jgi:hypothetical protein
VNTSTKAGQLRSAGKCPLSAAKEATQGANHEANNKYDANQEDQHDGGRQEGMRAGEPGESNG